MEIHVDTIDDCIRLARQCELESLIQLIEEKQKKLESFGKYVKHPKLFASEQHILTSADNLCKQLGPRSGRTECRA